MMIYLNIHGSNSSSDTHLFTSATIYFEICPLSQSPNSIKSKLIAADVIKNVFKNTRIKCEMENDLP